MKQFQIAIAISYLISLVLMVILSCIQLIMLLFKITRATSISWIATCIPLIILLCLFPFHYILKTIVEGDTKGKRGK